MCHFTALSVNPLVRFDGGREEEKVMNGFLQENYISNYLVKRFSCGRVHMGFIHRNRELHGYESIGTMIKLRYFHHYQPMLDYVFGKTHVCFSDACTSVE